MYRRNFVSAALLAMIAVTQPVLAAEPVKFATGVDATFLPLVIAVEKGFAKQRGLDATYKQFASGALSLEAVVSGDADIAMASEIATLGPRAKGAKIKTVARGAYSTELIGVAAIGSVNSAKDLVGKSVAYPKGTAGEYFMDLYFKKHSIAPGSVKLISVAPPEMVPLLSRGDVQAIFAWEPWFGRAKSVVKDFKVIDKSGKDDVYTMQFLTNFSEKFIQGRPDDARKALQAISDATDWLKDSKNAAEAAQILSKAFRVPEADAPQQLAQLRYTLDWPDVVRDDLVRAGEWLKAKNVIQTAAVSGLVSELLAPELLQQTKSDSVKK